MERVYSDTFIKDCANPIRVFSSESLQLIRNLIDKGLLHISLFREDSFFQELESLKLGNDYDKFTRKQLLDWIAGNKMMTLNFSNDGLTKANSIDCSSVWLNDEIVEEKLASVLDRHQLLSLIKDDIFTNNLLWLFRTSNLPTILLDKKFSWASYLGQVAHYTSTIRILDRYFFYNWIGSLNDIIRPFLDLNPHLSIEIIAEFESDSKSYPYAIKTLQQIFDEYPSQFRGYRIKKENLVNFHDRYLMTDYCLIKSEFGFLPPKNHKLPKQTTPTIMGRYAEDNEKWINEFSNWNKYSMYNCQQLLPNICL